MFGEEFEADINEIPHPDFATKHDKLKFLDVVVDKIVEKIVADAGQNDKLRVYIRDEAGLHILHELLCKYDYRRRLSSKLKIPINSAVHNLRISFPLMLNGQMPYVEIEKY